MREVYLAGFAQIVREAEPWTIMSSYNRINGTYASEHDWLLNTVLKGEWSYRGVVVSDWAAAKSTVASANGGLDLEMPGPARYYGDLLIAAVEAGTVSESTINEHASRVIKLIDRCGLLSGKAKSQRAELSSERHRALARAAAAEAIVLLKNDADLLPLKKTETLAVIGGLADYPAIQGGGSSQVSADRIVTPLEALTQLMPGQRRIRFERAIDHDLKPPTIDGRLLTSRSGKKGVDARYFAGSAYVGECVAEMIDWRFAKLGFGQCAQKEGLAFSVEWTGFFTPRHSGRHEFSVSHSNPDFELHLDGNTLIDEDTGRDVEMLFMILPMNRRRAVIELEAGKAYPILIRYAQPEEGSIRAFNILDIGLREPAPDTSVALEAASLADSALVFVGAGTTAETEGEDRISLKLPAAQNKLVEDVAARNANTVVIVNSGGPVEMPWADKVQAIVQLWLPGQEGGGALADILLGRTNPSGKLPMTFPMRYEDNPTFLHYPGGSRVAYGEGLFVGYRHYDAVDIEPLFAFGHGLSYSKFEIDELVAPHSVARDTTFTVSCRLTNTGKHAGAETVQLYIEHLAAPETMPLRQLKAFAKCELQPGDSEVVDLEVPANALAWYDTDNARWTTTAGAYRVHVGTSSRNLPLTQQIAVST